MQKIILNSLAETQEFGKGLAATLEIGSVLCLSGDLGTGKTTLSQAIIKHLSQTEEDITSPTFNLVHTYDAQDFRIWHFDLYRLEKLQDVYELGIEEAFETGVVIIEWPEIINDILPPHATKISISHGGLEEQRVITVQ